MSFKETLPTSSRRRSQSITDGDVINVENPEIINNDKASWVSDELKETIVRRSLDHIPELISLAKDIVEIRKIEVQTESAIKLLKQKGELLQDEARAFVIKESEKRRKFLDEGQMVRDLLRDLNSMISNTNQSDEIKKEIIRGFDNAIGLLLAQRREVRNND